MSSRTSGVAGRPVHYADFGGEGPRTLVLVHGLGGSHANWLAVGPLLARGARVVAPDLAGFGLTPPAGRSARLGAQSRLLEGFVAEVAPSGRAVIVGSSMGGLLALLVAARAPERVAGLVLVGAAQPRPRGASFERALTLAFAAYATPFAGEALLAGRSVRLGPEGLVRETLELCCTDPASVPREVLDAHLALARAREGFAWRHPAFLDATRSLLPMLLAPARYRALVRRVAAPAVLLHGTRDRLVPVEASRERIRERPDWRLEELEGLGHLPQLEDPERVARSILRFVGERPA